MLGEAGPPIPFPQDSPSTHSGLGLVSVHPPSPTAFGISPTLALYLTSCLARLGGGTAVRGVLRGNRAPAGWVSPIPRGPDFGLVHGTPPASVTGDLIPPRRQHQRVYDAAHRPSQRRAVSSQHPLPSWNRPTQWPSVLLQGDWSRTAKARTKCTRPRVLSSLSWPKVGLTWLPAGRCHGLDVPRRSVVTGWHPGQSGVTGWHRGRRVPCELLGARPGANCLA